MSVAMLPSLDRRAHARSLEVAIRRAQEIVPRSHAKMPAHERSSARPVKQAGEGVEKGNV